LDRFDFETTLIQPVKVSGKKLYQIMTLLIESLKSTIKLRMKEAQATYSETNYLKWINQHCSQVVISIDRLINTQKVEKAIVEKTLEKYLGEREDLLQYLIKKIGHNF